MITLRRAAERHYERVREQEDWLTFTARRPLDRLAAGFGSLEVFREGRLAPRSAFTEPFQDAEIVTYVKEGTLGYEDSGGRAGMLRAGEFLRMTGGGTVRFSEANVSPIQSAHVFQIWLRGSEGGHAPGHEQRRFSVAERRGNLRVVASPDGRRGSLRLHQDAVVFSMVLDRGQHLIHPFDPGRGAWLHVVEGAVLLGEDTLRAGDGAGIAGERVLSLTATEATEILLVDLVPN